MDVNIKSLKQRLNSLGSQFVPSADQKDASVLVPLLTVNNQWHLLFIRRAESVDDMHSGQVAFPGGHLKSGEAPITGALRETAEEIGLSPEHVTIIGGLGKFQSISNHMVTAIVGLVPYPYPFVLQEKEVSHIFTIPVDWLADRNNYGARYHSCSARKQIYYEEYDGEILWGLSAVICHALLKQLNA